MSGITLGQDSSAVTAGESMLESDAEIAIKAALASSIPWTATPFFSVITNYIVNAIVKELVTKLDDVAFAGYVCLTTGKQVSDYVKEQSSGDQTAIDNAADNLINLQDI